MKKKSIIGACLLLAITLLSCKSGRICPAFQSNFILDDSVEMEFFSLFENDSIPSMVFDVRKDKYGKVQYMSYRKKSKSLATVKMEKVYPPKLNLDSVKVKEDDFEEELMNNDSTREGK